MLTVDNIVTETTLQILLIPNDLLTLGGTPIHVTLHS